MYYAARLESDAESFFGDLELRRGTFRNGDGGAPSYGLTVTCIEGSIVATTKEGFEVNHNYFELLAGFTFTAASRDEILAMMSAGKDGSFSYSGGKATNHCHFVRAECAEGIRYTVIAEVDDYGLIGIAEAIRRSMSMLYLLTVYVVIMLTALIVFLFFRASTKLSRANERLQRDLTLIGAAISHDLNAIFYYDTGDRTLTPGINADKLLFGVGMIHDVPYDNVFSKMIYKGDLEEYRRVFSDINRGEIFSEAELRIARPDGSYAWRKLSLQTVDYFSKRQRVKAVGRITDINALQRAKYEAQSGSFVKNSLAGMYMRVYEINLTKDCFISGERVAFSDAGLKSAVSFSEYFRHICETKILKEDAKKIKAAYNPAHLNQLYEKRLSITYEYRWNSDMRGIIWISCTVSVYKNSDGDLIMLLLTSDIDQKKKETLLLIDKAKHDSATNLYNKVVTEECIVNILSLSHPCKMHAFVMFDIDKFKLINDTLGHVTGDERIIELALLLKSSTRTADIAGRVGGDEFVLFFKDIRNAEQVTERMRELLRDYSKLTVADDKIAHSLSAGIAFYPKDGKSYRELYKNADSALYRSKKSGGNTYTLYGENETVG
jgi:diguanylate cyclase (GGDEF)-like protein